VAGDRASRTAPAEPAGPNSYTVVARRYRPQRFEDVVGQDHVVQALRNALRLNRVTHAYLFSGTRGVGKTSMARIFAKCLNCVHGPTDAPCLKCDICQAIAVGQDVDVIEIDGASNNGVEAVRELRQNAGLRPSRARYKIYYIDEVHMLSTGAFNALLKTLEEPPEHVKFFFATTEPNKIPITVLSRCQRYDFAGIAPEEIVAALESICQREGVEVEPEALRAVARRATGSMRDAQSLLEQLLASGGQRLSVELVHALLGTASDERLLDLLDALADHNPAAALRLVEQAAGSGVQPTELLAGLFEFVRDAMVVAAGAGDDVPLLAATPRQRPRLQSLVGHWPLDSVLAALQILDATRARLRGNPHGRLLVEMALVRVARLEDFRAIGELIGQLAALEASLPPAAASVADAPAVATGKAGGAGGKKKLAPPPPETASPATPTDAPAAAPPTPASESPAPPPKAEAETDGAALEVEVVRKLWPNLIKRVGVGLGLPLTQVEPSWLAASGPDVLVIRPSAGYNGIALECDVPEARARIAKELSRLLNRPVTIRFDRGASAGEQGSDGGGNTPTSPPGTPATPSPTVRRPGDLEGDPMVRKVVQLFEARPVHLEVDEEREEVERH
jgi:DNA polymerase-3 subunit gamma/tau